MSGALSGKTVMVLGGSSPHGAAAARALGREGANVALGGRDRQRLEELEAEIRADGGGALVLGVHLAKRHHPAHLAEAAAEAFGGLDALLFMASAAAPPLGSLDVDAWENSLDVNFRGFVYCLAAALPAMRKRGGGRVVVVGAEGLRGEPDPFMRASRAAVRAILEELSERAVRLYRLHPLIHAFASTPADQPNEIVGDCTARVAEALGDPERLEREVFERGASEVLLDLLAASALTRSSGHSEGPIKRVHELLDILGTSGPVGWERARRPGSLLQHIRNHALFDLRDSDLATLAEEKLAARKLPYLRVQTAPGRLSGVRGHGLVDVTVTSDGSHAISTTRGGAITFWDISTGRPVRSLQGPTDWMLGPPALAGGGLVGLFASAEPGGRLTVWDLTSNRAAVELEGRRREQVTTVAISTNGRFAAAITNARSVIAWDLTRPEAPRVTSIEDDDETPFSPSSGEERRLAVTNDGAAVLIALEDGSIAIWSLAQDRIILPGDPHAGVVTSFAVAEDSRAALSCSEDGTMKLWDLTTCRLTRTLGAMDDQGIDELSGLEPRFLEFPNAIASAALTADGRFAFAVSESRRAGGEPTADDALVVWDLSAGEVVLKLPSSATRRNSRCAVTPDGRTLVVTVEAEIEVVEWVR